MAKRQIDIGTDLSLAFDLYKNNFGLLFVSGLVVALLTLCTCGLLYGTMLAGYSQIIRRLINQDPVKPTVNDIFAGFSLLVPTLMLTIVAFITCAILSFIPVIGRVLPMLISPLYIIGILFMTFAKFDLGATCKKLTDELGAGEVMPFLQVLIVGLVGGIGIVLCGVGVLLTYPLGVCAVIYGFIRSYAAEIKDAGSTAAPAASDEAPSAPTQP